MSIASVRYSASTSHQGLSNLKAGCGSVNCLNSATGIILPVGEEAGAQGPSAGGTWPRPALEPDTGLCPRPQVWQTPFPLPQNSPPSGAKRLLFSPLVLPGPWSCSDAACPLRAQDGRPSPGLCVWPSPGISSHPLSRSSPRNTRSAAPSPETRCPYSQAPSAPGAESAPGPRTSGVWAPTPFRGALGTSSNLQPEKPAGAWLWLRAQRQQGVVQWKAAQPRGGGGMTGAQGFPGGLMPRA